MSTDVEIEVVHHGPFDGAVTGGIKGVGLAVADLFAADPGISTTILDSGAYHQRGKLHTLRSRISALLSAHRSLDGQGVLHLHAAESSILWDALSAAVLRARTGSVVFHAHCSFDVRERARLFQKLGWYIASKTCDRLLVIAPEVDSQFHATWGHDRVDVVPNFVAADSFVSADSTDRQNVIVYLGRMTEGKGIYELLECSPYFEERGWKTRFVGPFAFEHERRAFMKELRRHPAVEWLGPLYGRDKTKTLSGCRIFVLPTKREVFPLSLLEAGAAGCAIVTTACGAIEHIVRHEETGVIMRSNGVREIQEAIGPLLDDESRRSALARRWQADVAGRFTDRVVRSQLKRIYEELSRQISENGTLRPLDS